jgi:hypothetical protein
MKYAVEMTSSSMIYIPNLMTMFRNSSDVMIIITTKYRLQCWYY